MHRAHRVAYYLRYRSLPKVVRHVVPLPPDVNPFRLEGGTQMDNIADRDVRDGTTARGRTHGRSKLTESDVVKIRKAHAKGASMTALGRLYGINRTTVRQIVTRETWQHVVP